MPQATNRQINFKLIEQIKFPNELIKLQSAVGNMQSVESLVWSVSKDLASYVICNMHCISTLFNIFRCIYTVKLSLSLSTLNLYFLNSALHRIDGQSRKPIMPLKRVYMMCECSKGTEALTKFRSVSIRDKASGSHKKKKASNNRGTKC